MPVETFETVGTLLTRNLATGVLMKTEPVKTVTASSNYDIKVEQEGTPFHYGFRMPNSYARTIVRDWGFSHSSYYTRTYRPSGVKWIEWDTNGSLSTSGAMSQVHGGYGWSIPTNLRSLLPSETWPTIEDRWAAEIACLNKIKDVKFSSTTFVAELTKTLGEITAKCVTLSRATTLARKGRWGASAKALGIKKHTFKSSRKEAANRWLELNYGWAPLYGDLMDAHDQFFNEPDVPFSARVFLGTRSKLGEGGKPIPTKLNVPVVMAFEGSDKASSLFSYTYASGVLVRLDYTLDRAALRAMSGLGMADPLSTAWELVPWSFVVDWTLPVGDWLSSLSATLGLAFRAGSYTYVDKVNATFEADVRYTANYGTNYIRNNLVMYGSAKMHRVRTQRWIYSGTPFPLPWFKSPFSTKRAINALALTQQNLKALR